MVQVFDSAAFRAAMEEKKTLVVDFWAEWCGPCRMLAPVLDEIAAEMQGKAVFVKTDIDRNPALAEKYEIYSVPCVKVFKGGKEIAENLGYAPKPMFRAFLNENL